MYYLIYFVPLSWVVLSRGYRTGYCDWNFFEASNDGTLVRIVIFSLANVSRFAAVGTDQGYLIMNHICSLGAGLGSIFLPQTIGLPGCNQQQTPTFLYTVRFNEAAPLQPSSSCPMKSEQTCQAISQPRQKVQVNAITFGEGATDLLIDQLSLQAARIKPQSRFIEVVASRPSDQTPPPISAHTLPTCPSWLTPAANRNYKSPTSSTSTTMSASSPAVPPVLVRWLLKASCRTVPKSISPVARSLN